MKSDLPNITGSLITGGAALVGATIGVLGGLIGGLQARRGARDLVLYTHLQNRREEVLAMTYEKFHQLHNEFAELIVEPERFPDPTKGGGPLNDFADTIDAYGQDLRSQALWLPEETSRKIEDHRRGLSDRIAQFVQIIHERERVRDERKDPSKPYVQDLTRKDFEGGPLEDLRLREQNAANAGMEHLYKHFRAVLRADDERVSLWSNPVVVSLIVLSVALLISLIVLTIVSA